MSFSSDIKKEAELIMQGFETTMRDAALALFSNIIYGTPVDTGLLRANWFASGAVPSNKQTDSTDKDGGSTAAAMVATIASLEDWSVFTLTNNKPYALTIEYGGYPTPVKKGSRTSAKGVKPAVYEILSSGGYSLQAPQGVVRINIIDIENRLGLLR